MARAWCLTVLAGVILTGLVRAQTEDLRSCPKSGDYPCGISKKLDSLQADSLLRLLKCLPEQDYGRALEYYLGTSYGYKFVDWVVFIGKDGTLKQALIDKRRFTEGNLVRGSQALFALIFTDTDLQISKPSAPNANVLRATAESTTAAQVARIAEACADKKVQCVLQVQPPGDGARSDGAPAAPLVDSTLQLSRTTLQYTREPAITSFINGIIKGIGGGGTPATTVPDSVVPIALVDIVRRDRTRADSLKLYLGTARVGLPNNALVRYTIRPRYPGRRYDLPSATSITRTIESASPNRFSASLGLGITVDAPDTSFGFNSDSTRFLARSSSSPSRPNAWILAHFYVKRPQLPVMPLSVSVVAGTNVAVSDLFRDLLLGVSVDRLFGDVGVMSGVNFIERQTGEPSDTLNGKFKALTTRSYRRGKVFLGINFPF